MSAGVVSGDRPGVFVSYAHADAGWRTRFEVMLAPLVGGLELWSDERLIVGQDWRGQLDEAIDRSQAALLLVSPEFLASQFIMREELPALVDRGVTLVCALVRPCMWQAVAALERVQWAHNPSRALSRRRDRDGAVVEICTKLAGLLGSSSAATRERADDAGLPPAVGPPAVPGLSASELGELIGVPALPSELVVREELGGVRDLLLSAGKGAVGVTGRGLGLHGHGGIGKTVLAAAVARDEQVRRHFPDGVYWVTLGEGADVVGHQRRLLAELGAVSDTRTMLEGKAALTDALADRRCLLIVDDVWSGDAAAAFRVCGPYGRVLYTTRDPAGPEMAGAAVLGIDVLPERAARQLLATLAALTVDTLPPEADAVLQATGGVALAIVLAGAAVGAGGTSWPALVRQLNDRARTFLTHPYANVFKAMHAAVNALSSDAQAYRSLAVFPPDTRVPVAAIARYWRHLWSFTPKTTERRLRTFADRELLSLEGEALAFHDLQRDFLLLQADDVPLLHGELLSAYRTLLAGKDSRWSELPSDEPYIWEHLIYHLRGAGHGDDLIALVCDLAYLAWRAFRSGPYASESDLLQAAALFPDHEGIAWLVRLFARWGHVFATLTRMEDLAVTIAARLGDAPASVNPDTLDPALPRVSLSPRWGLRDAPAALGRTLTGHTDRVTSVAFSPDGVWLASASEDGTVRIWDAASGAPTGVLEGHTRRVNQVAFASNDTRVASASDDGTVRIWDATIAAPTTVLEVDAGRVRGVAFSPDGTRVASACHWGTVRIWDAASGVSTVEPGGHTYPVNGVAFSPDGTRIASAAEDWKVRIWDATSGAPTAELEGHVNGVNGVAFSPDGTRIVSASADRTLRIWDAASGASTAELEGHTNGVNGVAFSPDGTRIASASADWTVRIWDAASGASAAELEGHAGRVNGVAFSPDGTRIASASDDGTVRIWDAASGAPPTEPEGHTDDVNEVAFSRDGRWLASASGDGTVVIWDATSGALLATLDGRADWVNAVAFSPDGTRVATGLALASRFSTREHRSLGNDGAVRIWHATSRALLATLDGHTGWVKAVVFSPDGTRLASASDDGTVRIWDATSGTALATLKGHKDRVNAVAFSPDGTRLASASDDRKVRIWDATSGAALATLKGHKDQVNAVAFSPDGTRLASASDDRKVRIWDATSGAPLATLKGHKDQVNAVAFSPDSNQLVSASDDRTVILWTLHTHHALWRLTLGVTAIPTVAWQQSRIALGTAAGEVAVFDVLEHNRPTRE